MFMVAYSIVNNAAIMQQSLPPTFPLVTSNSVSINPSSKLVIYAGTSGKFLYPGYKNFSTVCTFLPQSNVM